MPPALRQVPWLNIFSAFQQCLFYASKCFESPQQGTSNVPQSPFGGEIKKKIKLVIGSPASALSIGTILSIGTVKSGSDLKSSLHREIRIMFI